MEANGMRNLICNGDEEEETVRKEECSEERELDGEEINGSSSPGDANGSTPRTKLKAHQRQRSEVRKTRREHEVDQKKMGCVQNDKPTGLGDGEEARLRRSKVPKPPQGTPGKSQPQSPPNEDNEKPSQEDGNLNQPIRRRARRTLIRACTPPKEENERERVLRSTRTRGGETPPPLPVIPPGKGTKRSKRVAQRLANEEPPPPPLKLPRLQVVLSKKEIHDDWLKITGHKYTGKPRKSTMTAKGLNLCTSLTCPSTIRYLSDHQCEYKSAYDLL
ncbi:hypothetical protein R1sor_022808 [Riccia sorocarpa]|uniref:Uncharacterized protein n=1 Tax=Riccia sorocarpa TaxID=122646 RepID=A0ABD3GNX9_9MARC